MESAFVAPKILASALLAPAVLVPAMLAGDVLLPNFEKVWQSKLQTLSQMQGYYCTIDTTLIDQALSMVTHLLKSTRSSEEHKMLLSAVRYILSQPVYRNGTAVSRFNNYAKQKLIVLLKNSQEGTKILEDLEIHNPALAYEIDAYTTTLEI